MRGISRQAVLKGIQQGRFDGAFQFTNPDGTRTWLIPVSTLRSEPAPAQSISAAEAPIPQLESPAPRGAEELIAALGLGPELEADVRALMRRREAAILAFRSLPRKKSAAVTVDGLRRQWADTGARIAARWPSEAAVPSDRTLYRIACDYARGDRACLLGRIQPRLDRRRSATLGPLEADVEQLLASLRFSHPHAPVTTLARALADIIADQGLDGRPAPELADRISGHWVRSTVKRLDADHSMRTLALYGEKGLNARSTYIARDRSTVLPGAVYTVDHRQGDLEVIATNGQLVRPWMTLVVDLRTTLPVGWTILETAPDGNAVLAALANAMLPKTGEVAEALLSRGVDISSVCGVPDAHWLFDNGKDFSGRRIEGTEITPAGKVRTMDRRKYLAAQALLVEAAEELGNEANDPMVFGLAVELETPVRRCLPYNAKAKVVERVFGDISRGFDCLNLSHTGNNPTMRTEMLNERRRTHATLRKRGVGREDLAARTGFPLIEDYAKRLEAWIWNHYATAPSQAEGCQVDGESLSRLDTWNRLAPTRRVPTVEQLHRLSMIPHVAKVQAGGMLRVEGRLYRSLDLVRYRGAKVRLRYSPLDRSTVEVLGVHGQAPWREVLEVGEVVPISVVAQRHDLAVAMREQRAVLRAERKRVHEMIGNRVVDPLGSMMANHEAGRRGAIVAAAGQDIVKIHDIQPPVRPAELPPSYAAPIEDGEEQLFTSDFERNQHQARKHRTG